MKKTTRLSLVILALLTHSAVFAGPPPRTEASAVTPVDATWHAKWHTRIEATMKSGKGDFGFVLIGDSITDLWPGRGPKSYAVFLPWKPLNLGISGELTEHVLHRLSNGELDGIQPQAAMILIGTNNLGHVATEKPKWAAAGVKKIVETVRTKLPETKILVLGIFPRGGDRGPDGIRRSSKTADLIRQRVAATNRLIAPIADDKMVFFMDIGDKFIDAEGNLRMDLLPDALHPNEAGYQVWLEAVKPKLDELMK
jgi:lysophospholipase L1-like esterase